jgi:hypothetical protein
MSYVAGVILLYLDTYDSFALLVNTISQRHLAPVYQMSEEGLNYRYQIFRLLLKENLASVYDHFELVGV